MFEKQLLEKLKTIFDFDRVTYDQLSDSREQECLFVEINEAKSTIKDGKQIARVEGRVLCFANSEKLPYGYFQKKINEAKPEDTKDLFFYDLEANAGVIQNIKQRSMSFRYFFTGQYDPNLGSMTSIDISEGQ